MNYQIDALDQLIGSQQFGVFEQLVRAQVEKVREKIEKGVSPDDYREAVGELRGYRRALALPIECRTELVTRRGDLDA